MKVFSFIFILYLVVLLTQPCQDIVSVVDSTALRNASSQQPDNAPQSSSQDECSPLCICSCCSLAVAYHSSEVLVDTAELDVLPIAKAPAEYRNPDTDAYKDSIWQPPKA